jgi:hypothetical protein
MHAVAAFHKGLFQPEHTLAVTGIHMRIAIRVIVMGFHFQFAVTVPFKVADRLHLDPEPKAPEIQARMKPVNVAVVVIHLLECITI